MSDEIEEITSVLESEKYRQVGFGYGQLKEAARIAGLKYGTDWANKNPSTIESARFRELMRKVVIALTPKDHSNKDVVWMRFCRYAIQSQKIVSIH